MHFNMKFEYCYKIVLLLIVCPQSIIYAEKPEHQKLDKFERRALRKQMRLRDPSTPPTNELVKMSFSDLSHSDTIPLREQPNLSEPRRDIPDGIIRGSKRAITITRKDYLRKDWCKTEPFMQVVRVEGCLKRKIQNRFCYGQCNSFFIPKLTKSDSLSAAFENCSICKPRSWDWITITLRCPGAQPELQRKKIQRIKHCKCMAQTVD